MEVGGYLPRRTPYNITLRNMTVLASCWGRATTSSGSTWDHGVYLAHAVGVGPHDILIETSRSTAVATSPVQSIGTTAMLPTRRPGT